MAVAMIDVVQLDGFVDAPFETVEYFDGEDY